VVGLFFILDIIQERTGTRALAEWGGIASKTPRLATVFLIILMGAVGLPLTNGFIGEFLLLRGVFAYGVWYAVVGGVTLILGAVYMLRLYQKSMLGILPERYAGMPDIKGHELVVLAVIVFFTLFLGVWPKAILQLSEASVTNLLNQIIFLLAIVASYGGNYYFGRLRNRGVISWLV